MEIIERIVAGEPSASLTLLFKLRQKSRLLTQLDSGEKAALFLPRGTVLCQGDLLRSRCGRIIEVRTAAETVSTVTTTNPILLTRAAYHLGNRHIALEIVSGRLRYLHDPVLDALVRQLGLTVTIEQAPFEPEAGAYGGHHQG